MFGMFVIVVCIFFSFFLVPFQYSELGSRASGNFLSLDASRVYAEFCANSLQSMPMRLWHSRFKPDTRGTRDKSFSFSPSALPSFSFPLLWKKKAPAAFIVEEGPPTSKIILVHCKILFPLKMSISNSQNCTNKIISN